MRKLKKILKPAGGGLGVDGFPIFRSPAMADGLALLIQDQNDGSGP
jgi:hypothetical protein